MDIVFLNNKFVDKKNAKISLLSDAFQFGYGVYETLRTYGNKIILLPEDHIQRLFKSAKIIDLKIKHREKEILEMLKKTAKKSPHKIQKIKIISTTEGIIIISKPLKIDQKIYQGVKLKSMKVTRPYPEAKTLSYITSYLTHKLAAKENFYEALLIGENKEILEGSYSNIFWFEKNTLCTRGKNILHGITAQTVTKISPFKIKFTTIKLSDLLKKEEIFLTQTTKGIVPIVQIDNHKIGIGNTGEKTKNLTKLFDKYIKKYTERPK